MRPSFRQARRFPLFNQILPLQFRVTPGGINIFPRKPRIIILDFIDYAHSFPFSAPTGLRPSAYAEPLR
jgi:hypothetical protein